MEELISVILPVRNAQRTLAYQVASLLDIVPDRASNFELLIVDDASTDLTEELALELSQTYPQVRVVRHADRQGRRTAVQRGLELATGHVVFVEENPQIYEKSEINAESQNNEYDVTTTPDRTMLKRRLVILDKSFHDAIKSTSARATRSEELRDSDPKRKLLERQHESQVEPLSTWKRFETFVRDA